MGALQHFTAVKSHETCVPPSHAAHLLYYYIILHAMVANRILQYVVVSTGAVTSERCAE